MKSLIIYGSQYGTAKRYAETFAQMTGIPVINYKDRKELTEYEIIIYFGGLYAGSVKGLKKTIKAFQKNTKIVIVTVGLADVCNEENTNNIKKSLKKQVPEKILNNAAIFHLRGGIDYKKLNFKHRMMMALLYNIAKNLPEEEKTPEVKTLIDTFHAKVDFVDYNSLNQIIEAINQIRMHQCYQIIKLR